MKHLYAYEAITHTSHKVIIPLHQITSLVEELNTITVAGLGANNQPLVYRLTEEDFMAIKSHFTILNSK